MRSPVQENSILSQYFAPRGRDRLLFLGEQLSQRHLRFDDRLIGIVGDSGSGKSSLIKGMFPGLELSNDDDTMNPRKIMQINDNFLDLYDATSYHIDMRFQTAFTQMHEIVDFVQRALEANRRVVIEHFDLLYKALGRNADLLLGIGEEIIVTRPSIFGPSPRSIYDIVHESLIFRKMAHTIEDITIEILVSEFGINKKQFFSADMKNGFVLKFKESVDFDIKLLENKVRDIINKDLPVSYKNENHIMIGKREVRCTGPRLHVKNTSEVHQFSFIKRFVYDPKTEMYCFIGLLNENSDVALDDLNTINFLNVKISEIKK